MKNESQTNNLLPPRTKRRRFNKETDVSEIYELAMCKLYRDDHHFIKNPKILKCGHSFCHKCLQNELRCNSTIYCVICIQSFPIYNIEELTPNHFIKEIVKTIPEIHKRSVKELNKNISILSADATSLKFDDIFGYIEEEIQLRYESLVIELENIHNKLEKQAEKTEKTLRKINRNIRNKQDELKEKLRNRAIDLNQCRDQVKNVQYISVNQAYFDETDGYGNKFQLFKQDTFDLQSLLKDSFGTLRSKLTLNLRRFKTSRYIIHEFSNELNTIGGICRVDDDFLVATNPSKDSLIVFNDKLMIIKVITSIGGNRFSYPMAICSNDNGLIYICDCYNYRILIANKTLTSIKNTITTICNPSDVFYDRNYLYVLFSERKSLHKYSDNGDLLLKIELKPSELSSHGEIDPNRICIFNSKVIGLYSNNKVYLSQMKRARDDVQIVDNELQIEQNNNITGICYSSPYLLVVRNDGECCFYDVTNNFYGKEKRTQFKIIHTGHFEIFKRAIPCFITYVDEALYITFKSPHSHWMMKIDVR